MMNKFKLLIKKTLNSETVDIPYPIKKIQIILYNIIYKKCFSVLKIKELRQIKSLKEIAPISTFNSYEQKSLNEDSNIKTVTIPSVNLYIIENAIINISSSAIIKKNKLLFERININERFNEGNIKYHNRKYAVADTFFDEIIDEGLFLGGNGCWNWYHYIIEILPKALLTNQVNCRTLLISEDVLKYPTMYDTLMSIINDDYEIKILNKKKNYSVKKLFFINEINKIEFNKIDPNINNFITSYFRKDFLYNLRTKLFEKRITEKNKEIYKKIFLWREGIHRIAKNQNEVLEYLEKRGFKKIDPNKLNLTQQIQIFYSAEIIIGTTGAAWTNLIFCKPYTKAIIFSPIFFKDFNAFSNLANIFNVNLNYMYYNGNKANHSDNDFYINMEELKYILKNYGE